MRACTRAQSTLAHAHNDQAAVRTHSHKRLLARADACMHARSHARSHTDAHMLVHERMHMCARAHVHMRAHTHTYRRRKEHGCLLWASVCLNYTACDCSPNMSRVYKNAVQA